MTKDKMIEDLTEQTSLIFLGSVILGIVSVGILSYVAVRYWRCERSNLVLYLGNVLIRNLFNCLIIKTWNKWKLWNNQREPLQIPNESEDADEIPDGQLCVICVTRRVPAFIPCGHVVCCRLCASTVERELNPKCLVL